jgi:hypothetical protein
MRLGFAALSSPRRHPSTSRGAGRDHRVRLTTSRRNRDVRAGNRTTRTPSKEYESEKGPFRENHIALTCSEEHESGHDLGRADQPSIYESRAGFSRRHPRGLKAAMGRNEITYFGTTGSRALTHVKPKDFDPADSPSLNRNARTENRCSGTNPIYALIYNLVPATPRRVHHWTLLSCEMVVSYVTSRRSPLT